MDNNIFYSGLDIRSSNPVDQRMYIDDLTISELQRVFGLDGSYGSAKVVTFNKAINKFIYLANYSTNSDVINPSKWSILADAVSEFPLYVSSQSYNAGSCITFTDSFNSKKFYIGLESINENQTPETHPLKWFNLSKTSTSIFTSVTKNELDTLIGTNNLIPGSTYRISNADIQLYGGTMIFLTAITTNKLSITGTGRFFNPKYNQAIAGFNIWTSSAISTGSYHWGGKTWYWGGGPIFSAGTPIDIFTLSTGWLALPFDAINYNEVYDEIKYDIVHDKIVYRNEQNNNIVSSSASDISTWIADYSLHNPIKAFMWGNIHDNVDYIGIGFQKLIDSYNENINFTGAYQYAIVMTGSYQSNIKFGNGSGQFNITMSNSGQKNLILSDNVSQQQMTFMTYDYDRLSETLTSNEYGLWFMHNISQVASNTEVTKGLTLIDNQLRSYNIPEKHLSLIEATKSELDALILLNDLKPGVLYNITDVHKSLYDDGTNSGTSIYLQALTTKTLAKQGHGEFFTPNHSKNLQEWSNISMFTPIDELTKTDIYGVLLDANSKMIISSTNDTFILIASELKIIKITSLGVQTEFVSISQYATDFCFDSLDNIYVCHGGDLNKVVQITTGGVSTDFGTTGTTPASIAADSLDNIYVCNTDSNNVTKITPLGVSTVHGSTRPGPVSIAIDSLDNIYTVNQAFNDVTQITSGGLVTQVFAIVETNPVDITIDNNDNLYVVNRTSGSISKITQNSEVTTIMNGLSDPRYITIDKTRSIIWIACRNGASIAMKNLITNDTRYLSLITENPQSIAINSEGTVFILLNSGFISRIIESFIIGDFDNGEPITSDLGGTGYLVEGLISGLFIRSNENWTGSTIITGDWSGAVANIKNIVLKNYDVDDVVHYNCYVWKNLTGAVGVSINPFTLDDIDQIALDSVNWVKIPYTTIDYYTMLTDIIHYDRINDWLSYRHNIELDVSSSETYEVFIDTEAMTPKMLLTNFTGLSNSKNF